MFKNEDEAPINDLKNIKKEIVPKKLFFDWNKKEILSEIYYSINSGFTIAMLLVSFAILNQKQINSNIKTNPIPNNVFILTSIFSLFISFIFSGDLKVFKSFSITSIVLLNIIIIKFGVTSLPLCLIFVSVNLIIFVITRLARFIYLIPKSIVLSMNILVTLYLILIEIANYNQLVYNHKHMSIFMILKFFAQNGQNISIESILIYIVCTILVFLLFFFFQKIPWFLLIMIFGNLAGWIILKYTKIATIDQYFFNSSESISIFLLNNLSGFINYKVLTNQEFYLYTLALSLLIFFESALTMKFSRLEKNSKLKTNFKLELFGLIISNFFGSLIGCLPMTISFPNNYISKQVRGNNRFAYLIAMVVIIFVSIPAFSIFRYIPIVVMNVSITALALLGISFSQYFSYIKYNKKTFLMIVINISVGLFFDLIYTFCISLIIFYFYYFLNNEDMVYILEDQNQYMEKVINYEIKHISSNKDVVSLYNNLDLNNLKDDIVKSGIVYELRGCFNFIFSKLHINNAAFINKKIFIIDMSKIMKFDYDFIEEYYKLVKRLESYDYIIYISGIRADRFQNDHNLKNCSWLNDKYLKDRILFLDNKIKSS